MQAGYHHDTQEPWQRYHAFIGISARDKGLDKQEVPPPLSKKLKNWSFESQTRADSCVNYIGVSSVACSNFLYDAPLTYK